MDRFVRPPDRRQQGWDKLVGRIESHSRLYSLVLVIFGVGVIVNGIFFLVNVFERHWATSLRVAVVFLVASWLTWIYSAALRRRPSPPRVWIWPRGRRTDSA